jgi:hypothetical protein
MEHIPQHRQSGGLVVYKYGSDFHFVVQSMLPNRRFMSPNTLNFDKVLISKKYQAAAMPCARISRVLS